MVVKDLDNLPPPSSPSGILLGSMVIGMMVEEFLLGVTCSQAVAYFRYHFSSDHTFCRSIVTCLVICTALLGILNFISLYHSLVSDYGDYDKFNRQDWVLWMQPGFNAWIAFVAHVFYIFRCWAVTRSPLICIFLGIVALSALVSGITMAIFGFSAGSNLSGFSVSGFMWSISATVCDAGTAAVLMVYFRRRRSVLCSSDAMISRLLRTTIETGLLTLFFVVLDLVFSLTVPEKGYGFGVQFSFSHIYTISVLYTLLGRQELRDILKEGSGTFVTEFQTSFLAADVLSMSLLND